MNNNIVIGREEQIREGILQVLGLESLSENEIAYLMGESMNIIRTQITYLLLESRLQEKGGRYNVS